MKQLTLYPNIMNNGIRLAGIPLRIWHDHLLDPQQAPTESGLPYLAAQQLAAHAVSVDALVDVPVEAGA